MTMKANFELHLLLPADHLPAEGHESAAFAGANSDSELIGWFVQHLPEPSVILSVGPNGLQTSASEVDLRHALLVWRKGEADAPWVDPSGAEVSLTLDPTVLSEDLTPRYPGEERTVEDWLRGLLAKVRSLLEPSVRGFRGTPLPLLEWVAGDAPNSGHVVFHGVWLADPDSLTLLKRWDEEAELGLIFEESDVEGRGLREMMAAALMLGVVMSAPAASAGEAKAPAQPRAGLVSALRSLFGKSDEAPAKTTPATKTAKTSGKKSSSGESVRVQVAKQAPAKIDEQLLKGACDENVNVIVDIGKQRAFLLVDGKIAIDTPISSAMAGRWTPRGTFTITEKVRTGKMSTIYKCPLPFWMRLGESAVGMHIGDLPGYPASHGCVRLPREIAPVLFDHTFRGTQVRVVDSWNPQPIPPPEAQSAGLVAKQ